MAPVFTPFDDKALLNVSVVDDYAKSIAQRSVKAVLVNGTVGEGVLMSLCERKQLAEAWVKAAEKYELHVMVHVGGTNLNGVRELAEHAESLKVSSILCLPDFFFRPTSINELVDYLKVVSKAAPNTPLFYYNYPALNGVKLDMVKFLELGYDSIPTLAGFKYTDVNLEESFRCTQVRNGAFTIFLGCDQLTAPALSMGFDSFITTFLNVGSQLVFKIQDKINSGNNEEARQIQTRITNLCTFINNEMQWINGFKEAITLVTGIELGAPRAPLPSLTDEQKTKLKEYLTKEKFL